MAQQQAGVRERGRSEAQGTDTVRDLVLDVMLDKIDDDRYPSVTMMDEVEKYLTPSRRRRYVKILLEKVRDDQFPSWDMLQRLIRLGG